MAICQVCMLSDECNDMNFWKTCIYHLGNTVKGSWHGNIGVPDPGSMPRHRARGCCLGHLFLAFLFCKQLGRSLVRHHLTTGHRLACHDMNFSMSCISLSNWLKCTNVGHNDLYFTFQWFCLGSWRLMHECHTKYDATFDLKINGHNLYFTVQWFCLMTWRLFYG